jgi:CheY-like chemotaxis protein
VGVGISGMRERLHELDGRLEIRTGNWGTRVTAYLPNLKEQLCDPNPQVFPESPTVVAPAPSVSLKRILIVDDHELMRRGVRDLIEQESDLEICDEASSAAEAIEKILDQNPDLVILDLNMPGGNGWHVIREIRKLGLSTRIVILTAYELETLFYTATAAGCDGVVIKSRANRDLMAAIHAISNGQKFFQRPRPVGR